MALLLAALASLAVCLTATAACAVATSPRFAIDGTIRAQLYAGSVACFWLLGHAWLAAAPAGV